MFSMIKSSRFSNKINNNNNNNNNSNNNISIDPQNTACQTTGQNLRYILSGRKENSLNAKSIDPDKTYVDIFFSVIKPCFNI